MLLFDQSCSSYHGRQGIADFVNRLREQMLCHHGPGRAAGSQCKRLFAGSNLIHIVFRFCHTTQIRADCRLIDIRKSQFLQCGLEHLRRHLWPELSHKGRRHLRYNFLP